MLGQTGQLGAERVDRGSGIRERAAFLPFGAGDDQLFVCTYEPAGESVGSVLICSSILADFLANYQREVNLARAFAKAGMTAVRFHYRGTGHSDGDPAAMTLASLEADARWAAEQLTSWRPDLPIAFLGTRWGALSATAAARDYGDAPVELCEPIIDFGRYYSDAMRSRSMSAMATGKSRKDATQVSELLARDGHADIVGNVIHSALYDSTVGVDPVALLSEGKARAALLVQFGGKDVRAPLRKVEQKLVGAGWRATSRTVDVAENWWFRTGRRMVAQDELDDASRTWLRTELETTRQDER